MTFEARYQGKCADCGESIEVGDEVQFTLTDDLIHADCVDDLRVGGVAERETCGKCWMIKPCACDDE